MPAPGPLAGDGAAVISARSDQQGLEIDAQTGFPGWHGERADYGRAVNALAAEAGHVRAGV